MEKYGRNPVSSDVLEEIGFFRKKPNPDYKLEIEIFRNSTLKNVGVLRGSC